MSLVRGVVADFGGPFHLSEVADAVRRASVSRRAPAGRAPGRATCCCELQAAGEIAMLSAPDELLDAAATWSSIATRSGSAPA